MKRLIGVVIALAWLVSAPFAEAIEITLAEVQNGVAVVDGNKAAKQATIVWETGDVGHTTTAEAFASPGSCLRTASDNSALEWTPSM
jgi:hypothetical protein